MCRGPDTAQTRPRSEPPSECCVSRGATPQRSISPFHPNAPYSHTEERETQNERGRFYFCDLKWFDSIHTYQTVKYFEVELLERFYLTPADL